MDFLSKYIGAGVPTDLPDTSSSIASLDPDMLDDLRRQLKREFVRITNQYSFYVSCIRETLQEKGVSPKDLGSDLITKPAFNNTKGKPTLLSTHKAELEGATDLNTIFNLLATEYASFLDYEIFQYIVDHIDEGQKELKYAEHLEAYIKKLKISEFIEINPQLETLTKSSKIFLKIDIESTSEVIQIKTLKSAVADILGIKSAAIRLLDIKDGCVAVTFQIPTPIVDAIFNKNTTLTEEQLEKLRAFSVLQLQYDDYLFDFTGKNLKDSDDKSKEER